MVLVDVSILFIFCSAQGRGMGESEVPGGVGGSVSHWKSRGRLPEEERGWRARGQEGVCGEFGGGAGAKYFFGGRKFHQVLRFQGPPTEVKLGKSGKYHFWGQKWLLGGVFIGSI